MTTIQIEATPIQLKQINAFVEKIGAKIVESEPKKTSSKKEFDINFLENREECKKLKNEVRRKYNENAKTKVEYII